MSEEEDSITPLCGGCSQDDNLFCFKFDHSQVPIYFTSPISSPLPQKTKEKMILFEQGSTDTIEKEIPELIFQGLDDTVGDISPVSEQNCINPFLLHQEQELLESPRPSLRFPDSLQVGTTLSDSNAQEFHFLQESMYQMTENQPLSFDNIPFEFHPSTSQVQEISHGQSSSVPTPTTLLNQLQEVFGIVQKLARSDKKESKSQNSKKRSRKEAIKTTTIDTEQKKKKQRKAVNVKDNPLLEDLKKKTDFIEKVISLQLSMKVTTMREIRKQIQAVDEMDGRKDLLVKSIYDGPLSSYPLLQGNSHSKSQIEEKAIKYLHDTFSAKNFKAEDFSMKEANKFFQKQALNIMMQIYFMERHCFAIDSFACDAYYTKTFQQLKDEDQRVIVFPSNDKSLTVVVEAKSFTGVDFYTTTPKVAINGRPAKFVEVCGNKTGNRVYWRLRFELTSVLPAKPFKVQFQLGSGAMNL